jgi:hypothetical protein
LRDQASDALIGNVTWQLEGVFERSSTGSSGDWTSLGGEGGLTVIFEE